MKSIRIVLILLCILIILFISCSPTVSQTNLSTTTKYPSSSSTKLSPNYSSPSPTNSSPSLISTSPPTTSTSPPATSSSPPTSSSSTQITTSSQPSNELTLQIISRTSPVKHGAYATLIAQTIPGAKCDIVVYYKSGPSTAQGLYTKTADENGQVSWTWKVGTNTTPGSWLIVVTANYKGKSVTQSTYFTVT